jgi:hypothetical protein
MRLARIGSVLAAGTLLVAGTAALATPAVTVAGVSGRTTVTTAPELAGALLSNGILPYSVGPAGTDRFSYTRGNGLQITYGFPVISLTSNPAGDGLAGIVLGAQVGHSGGLAFFSFNNFKRVKVSDFTIDVPHGQLIAGLTGFKGIPNGTRVAIFNLAIDPSKATIANPVVVPDVKVTLTSAAAGALNASLKTNVFAAGLAIGTAKAVIKLP